MILERYPRRYKTGKGAGKTSNMFSNAYGISTSTASSTLEVVGKTYEDLGLLYGVSTSTAFKNFRWAEDKLKDILSTTEEIALVSTEEEHLKNKKETDSGNLKYILLVDLDSENV
ncbi:hypothetical protein H0W26_05835 [Candidatus Dependentiae bacterium]|nr:hypothetical protein [Candidatus Dependentiae bacterium]